MGAGKYWLRKYGYCGKSYTQHLSLFESGYLIMNKMIGWFVTVLSFLFWVPVCVMCVYWGFNLGIYHMLVGGIFNIIEEFKNNVVDRYVIFVSVINILFFEIPIYISILISLFFAKIGMHLHTITMKKL